ARILQQGRTQRHVRELVHGQLDAVLTTDRDLRSVEPKAVLTVDDDDQQSALNTLRDGSVEAVDALLGAIRLSPVVQGQGVVVELVDVEGHVVGRRLGGHRPQVRGLPGTTSLSLASLVTEDRQFVPSGVADVLPVREVPDVTFKSRVEGLNLFGSRGFLSNRGGEDEPLRSGVNRVVNLSHLSTPVCFSEDEPRAESVPESARCRQTANQAELDPSTR